MSLLPFLCDGLRRHTFLLSAQRNEASGLLVQHLSRGTRRCSTNGVDQKQRDRGAKTHNRGHKSLRDTVSHQLRVTGTVDRDRGKRHDHTDNCTEQPEQAEQRRPELSEYR